MKKPITIIITVAVLLSLVIANATINNSAMINKNNVRIDHCIIIDAGHGGKDCGTIGVDGALEKEINLDISLALYDFLKVVGYNTQLIRDGDYQLYYEEEEKSRSDLYNRLDFVNDTPDSTLISIHQNHFDDEREWGMQVWYSPNDDQSKLIADSILNYTNDNIQKGNTRTNKESDSSYYLLYKATAPSVMVECGFMSNIKENKLLQNNDYQRKLAYSIMMGYNNYKNTGETNG